MVAEVAFSLVRAFGGSNSQGTTTNIMIGKHGLTLATVATRMLLHPVFFSWFLGHESLCFAGFCTAGKALPLNISVATKGRAL